MKVVVDTDLNFPSDDFQALLLLLTDSNIHLLGCCAAAGNTWAEEVAVNLEEALRRTGRPEIPILTGAAHDSFLDAEQARSFVGRGARSFIGAYGKSDRPRAWITGARPTGRPASDFLVDTLAVHPNEVQLACLGPLTNIAHAMAGRPDLARLAGRTFVMGGHFGPVDAIDFNVWFDPLAAQSVFDSGMPIVLLPLDVCRSAAVSGELIESLCSCSDGLAGLFVDDFLGMVVQHGSSMPLCDQLLTLVVRNPGLIVASDRGRVRVDSSCSATRGTTTFHVDPDGPVEVVREIDACAVHAALLQSVEAMRRFACPAVGFLGTPRFQYLVQLALERDPVWFCQLTWDSGRVTALEPRLVRDAADFALRAEGAMGLLMRARGSGRSARCDASGETFRTLKHHESVIVERLATAKVIVFVVDAGGEWRGLQCLSDDFVVIDAGWDEHDLDAVMGAHALAWRTQNR